MFHFTSSVQRRALYLMNSTAGEMNSEACGRHSPLSTVEGLTSKPLFIPQLTVVRQPKCQWVRSYLQACFRCPLFHEGTLPKKSSSLRTSGGFSSLGNKQSALTAACWGEQNGPVLFSFLYLLRFFSFFLICPDRVAMTTQLSPIGSGSPSPHSFFFYMTHYFPTILSKLHILHVIMCAFISFLLSDLQQSQLVICTFHFTLGYS